VIGVACFGLLIFGGAWGEFSVAIAIIAERYLFCAARAFLYCAGRGFVGAAARRAWLMNSQ